MKLAIRTNEYPIGKGKFVQESVTATRTGLASVGRVDSYEHVASFSRFATHHTEKSRPGSIVDAFRQAMAVGHPVYVQIFNCNEPVMIYYFPAVLVREVGALEP
ncbi:MAG: hypothetical protein WCS37_20020, partial [Chloroflexota bacterium]